MQLGVCVSIHRKTLLTQKTAAVKKVFTPGQVSLMGASGVQTSGIWRIWKFKTPMHTKLDTRVAMIWAQKVWRGGILV
jgi:hypothetical protein